MAQRRTTDAGLTDSSRRALLVAAAALPACSVLPTDGGPPSARPPAGPLRAATVRMGDRWRYRCIDRQSGYVLEEPTWEVVEAGDALRVRVSGRRGAPATEERFAGAWLALNELMYGVSFAFAEPVPLVPPGLEPGSSRSTSTSWLEPETQRRRSWSQQLRVGDWERIEVPAGTFDCLRVSRAISFDHPDRERRNARRVDVLWYAPEVNRWVQRDQRGDFISSGLGDGNPAEGIQGRDEALRWVLTSYLPAPVAR